MTGTNGRGRRALGRLALVAMSTVLALGAAEIAVRATGHGPSRWAHSWHLESPDKRHGLDLYADDARRYFPLDLRDATVRAHVAAQQIDVGRRWERTPHGVPFEYTAELCRGGEIPPRDPARRRVVVIGDSFTEGQGVREEDTFVAQLGRAHRDADLVNCGRRGYDFPDLASWFDRHLALGPDVVVYAMVLNDVQQSAAFHARQRYLDDWILDRRRMVTDGDGAPPPLQSWLWALAADRLEQRRVAAETTRWYQEMVEPPNRAGWDATLAHLAQMDATMRARGGSFVVVLWPLLVDLDGDYPFAATHATIGAALRARHIAFVDTLPAFRGHDAAGLWVDPTDHHPNESAHRIFADAVGPAVNETLTSR